MHTLTGNERLDAKLIQQLACELLIESNFHQLPIIPYESLDHYGNIYYKEIGYLTVIFKIDRDRLASSLGACTLHYDSNADRYWLFFNRDKCSSKREISYMFAVAYAYIELHMVTPDDFIDLTDDVKSVHYFANYYLAPDIILEECNMINGISLAHYTLLPFRQILCKEKALKSKKNEGLKRVFTILERMLLQNFAEFIAQTKEELFK